MQMVANRQSALLGLVLLLLAAGCDAGARPLAPVRGKVSYQGRLLRGGTIVFTPDPLRGTSGPVARAEIQADGSYVLHTKDEPGAAAGWHRVTLVSLEIENAETSEGRFVVPRSLLPEKFRDPELSGLVCEVKAGQENSIDFNLE